MKHKSLTVTIDFEKALVGEVDGVDPTRTVVKLLRKLADRYESGVYDHKTLYDDNGNPIGKAVLE